MSGESPASVLFSSDGTELAVVQDAPYPVGTRGILTDGYVSTAAPVYTDGTTNFISLAPNGNLRTQADQGSPNTLANAWPVELTDGYGNLFGEPNNPITVNINGTVVTSNLSVGLTGVAPPPDATYIGALTATNAPAYASGLMEPLSLTTAGLLRIDGVYPGQTVYSATTDLAFAGAAVSTAAPAYTDGQISALSLTTNGDLRTRADQGLPTTLANAWPVELTDGYGNLFGEPNNPISVTGTITVDNLSVGVPGTTPPADATYVGALTATTAPTYGSGLMEPFSLTLNGLLRIDGVYPINAATPTTDVTFVGGAVTTANPVYTTGQLSALSLDTSGNLRVVDRGERATTSTFTNVAGATTSTTILVANANRIRAAIYNNTNKNMYVLYNSAAATTTDSFSILIMKGSYVEVPEDYTGQINAIWSNGVSGNANVTEFSP